MCNRIVTFLFLSVNIISQLLCYFNTILLHQSI
nr:MAG TPA: hypothetical protein [Caudoviricetes sp.]